MANSKIFCNAPWYELQIYWDGGLGICCQESHRIYAEPGADFTTNTPLSDQYNVKNLTIKEWFNHELVRKFRKDALKDTPISHCSNCYNEEKFNLSSRRHRSNQKSVIFTLTAFEDSFNESPHYPKFRSSQDNDGYTDSLPVDLHIDLGNYCNLACKMCYSGASSKIAAQNVKWGTPEHEKYLKFDWTKDEAVWNKVLNEIVELPNVKNIHFMGGETLITPRFEQFLDFMIAHEKFNLNFSFVSNGTSFNPRILDKLKRFQRVGIEVSIETVSEHNNYVRQGSNTAEVLANIKRYQDFCTNSLISITLRPTISLLTIGNYYTLLEYCLDNKLLIKSLLLITPKFLDPKILPYDIKQLYRSRYDSILEKVKEIDIDQDFNESDPANYLTVIKRQIIQTIGVLDDPTDHTDEQLLSQMVEHCRKWDQVYNFDAPTLYPELAEIFKKYGY